MLNPKQDNLAYRFLKPEYPFYYNQCLIDWVIDWFIHSLIDSSIHRLIRVSKCCHGSTTHTQSHAHCSYCSAHLFECDELKKWWYSNQKYDMNMNVHVCMLLFGLTNQFLLSKLDCQTQPSINFVTPWCHSLWLSRPYGLSYAKGHNTFRMLHSFMLHYRL